MIEFYTKMDLNHTNLSICRVCMCHNGVFKSIFTLENFSEHTLRINEVMITCASVQVEVEDGLPQEICAECLRRLSEAFAFKNLCEQTDFTLRNNVVLIVKSDEENVQEDSEQVNIIEGIENIAKKKNEEVEDYTEALNEIDSFVDEVEHNDISINENANSNAIHTVLGKSHQCNHCGKCFCNKSGLVRHMKTHSGRECSVCRKYFSDETALEKHRGTHTEADKSHECDQCSMRFYARWKLDRHVMLKHSGERRHGCAICKKRFKYTHNLSRHMKTHPDLKKANIGVVGEISEENVDENIEKEDQDFTENMKEVEVENKNNVIKNPGRTNFQCKICGKYLRSRSTLSTHRFVHLKKKPYECVICEQSFAIKRRFENHKRRHSGEKPFACDECDTRFIDKYSISKHKKLFHGAVKMRECPICKRYLADTAALESHLGTHSVADLQHQCDQCGKSFYTRARLVQHMKIHSGRAHCFICRKSFPDKETLKLHRGTHTAEEKIHECDLCSKRFFTTSKLTRHMISHTGEKRYECFICEKSFAYTSSLRQHVKTHIGPYECNIK